MIDTFWLQDQPRFGLHQYTFEKMLEMGPRFHIYCMNQEEKDYLVGLGLMVGRSFEILVATERQIGMDNPYPDRTVPLPFTFTTREIYLKDLP